MKTAIDFKKTMLSGIVKGENPFWCGIEIEEINFGSMNVNGKLDVVLTSGKTVNVSIEDINLR